MVAEFQDARSFGGPSLIVVSPGFDGDRRAFFCAQQGGHFHGMAGCLKGITQIYSAAGLSETLSSDEIVLVYFSFGAKSAETPHSLGDDFDPQFEEFGESEDVVPRLFRATYSQETAQFFADVGIDPVLGGSLVLWRQGMAFAKASVKELNESEEMETEVARWLGGKYPSSPGAAKAKPARPASATARGHVAGPTPGASCGAPPVGPPPPANPSVATNVVFGAALSGPPPGPKAPTGTMTVGAALSGPPPGPKAPTGTMTVGAALSGPPPGPKAPTGTMTVGAALSGPPPGPKAPTGPRPTTTVTVGAALSGPPPGPKAPTGPRPTTTVTVGAALSGPPPGPKAPVSAFLLSAQPQREDDDVDAPPPPPPPPPEGGWCDFPPPPPKPQYSANDPVPIESPETPCPIPPPQPTPPATPTSSQPAPTPPTLTSTSMQAAHSEAQPPQINQATQSQSESAPLPPKLQSSEAAPEPRLSNPSLDDGEQIAKLFASHTRQGVVNRDTMKALLQFLLSKQGSRKGLSSAHLDRIVDSFVEESPDSGSINANQFIQWVWSGAKSRK
ncbi:unnamed protein product [Durusdinium trenchii]|uniref:Uncharacterized protein n=1 Tax=Durusdinium trenchii TaxID=1381693 RepID=A0ABP0QPD5_9DINO